MYVDIVLDKASERPKRHLPPEYKAWQRKKLRCSFQTQWPIQCPCVPKKISSRFRPVAGPVLALVPTKLVKNWQAQCTKFLDTDYPKLNIKVYIRHRSVTFNERIGLPKGKKMMIQSETQPTTNASKYFIITLLTSYKNNVLYYLLTHDTGFVTVPGTKK